MPQGGFRRPSSFMRVPNAFVGDVNGVGGFAPLSETDARAIDAAMERHGVLVF